MIRSEMIHKLEQAGCRLTAKRLLMIDEIIAIERIDDVDQFWMSIRLRVDVSWATVHNFLNQLSVHGLLRKTTTGGKSLVYQLNED